jgi:hypothetical protein
MAALPECSVLDVVVDLDYGNRMVTKEIPEHSYEAEVTIAAQVETVWAILQDGPGYPSWGSGITELSGTIADGNRITFRTEVAGKRKFKVKVSIDADTHTMTWTGGMPFGLFRGVRTFRVEPAAPGTTHFHMREVYTGPMVKTIWKQMPDLGPSFVQFATALQTRAESGAASSA